MRKKAALINKKAHHIAWRSHEPSRLETFSDAVFAFAVTLIIVSLEVPKSFTELYEVMKGVISFGACFLVLFLIWNNQNKFFRNYGLNDAWTVALNAILLFVVLVYVYPLKFLFGLLFFDNTYVQNGQAHTMITLLQVPDLMLIYGAGYTANNLLFFLMHVNALKHKAELKLNEIEVYETKTTTYMYLICSLIGCTAMLLAWLLPVNISASSGYFYMSIGFAYFIFLSYRNKKRRRKFEFIEQPAS